MELVKPQTEQRKPIIVGFFILQYAALIVLSLVTFLSKMFLIQTKATIWKNIKILYPFNILSKNFARKVVLYCKMQCCCDFRRGKYELSSRTLNERTFKDIGNISKAEYWIVSEDTEFKTTLKCELGTKSQSVFIYEHTRKACLFFVQKKYKQTVFIPLRFKISLLLVFPKQYFLQL